MGKSGSGDGEFNVATGVATDASGRIVYVTDQLNHRVQVFDAEGHFLRTFGTFGSSDGQFQNPVGVAANASGSIVYVVDAVNNRVQVFDTAGNFLAKFGGSGSGNGSFSTPSVSRPPPQVAVRLRHRQR